MKKIVVVILLVLLILTFSITAVYASGGIIFATTGFEKQEKSNWCWVASALNSVHHETSSHRTQKQAVMHIKGSILDWYPNVRGSTADIKEAAEYISKNTESYTAVAATKSFSFLKNQVDINNGTIACLSYYDFSGSQAIRTGGHAVLIIGYYVSDYDDFVVYFDPADGTSNTCSFIDFSIFGNVDGGIYEQTCYNNET